MGYEPTTKCSKCGDAFDVYRAPNDRICDGCLETWPAKMLAEYGRVELGVDGNAGFALLGPDLQEGEAEFVEIPGLTGISGEGNFVVPTGDEAVKLRVCKSALKNLCVRLKVAHLPYYFGHSHPYGQ